MHAHVKPFMPSVHVPPFRHGAPAHSSMSASTAHRTGERVWRQTRGTTHAERLPHTQHQPLTRFAILPGVARDARAVEVVHEVLARAAIVAHDALAVVDVCKHGNPDPPAGAASDKRNYADRAVRTYTAPATHSWRTCPRCSR